MALKPCRECSMQVSDSAKTCPHCGIRKPVRKRVSLLWIIPAAIIIAVVAMPKEQQTSSKQAKTKIEQGTTLAHTPSAVDPHPDNIGRNIQDQPERDPDKELTHCLLPKAQYGQYSSFDGGKSAASLLQEACPNEYLSWIEHCRTSGDEDGSCITKAVIIAQIAIKSFNK